MQPPPVVPVDNVDAAQRMEIYKRDAMFDTLCKMSDRQVDPEAKDRLKRLMGRSNADIKDELLGLIDDIVLYTWTGIFERNVLHSIWCALGGSDKELLERNSKPMDTADNRAKYKWER